MSKTITRVIMALLIAAALVGAYLIVARNGPPPVPPGEAIGFSH